VGPSRSKDSADVEGEDTSEPSKADLLNDGLCHEVASEEIVEEQFRHSPPQEISDDCYKPVLLSAESPPFLVSLPPPVSLVRDDNAVLMIGEAKGSMLPPFSLKPWALEVSF